MKQFVNSLQDFFKLEQSGGIVLMLSVALAFLFALLIPLKTETTEILSRITPNKNIRIIKPDEKVNSWSIYDITTLGLVHTTTAGMEMPLVNKPCAVVSKTHYRDKGFTIDINSKKEYFDLLDNFDVSKIDLVKNKKEALKYAYLLFIRYQIPFNMFFEEITTSITGFRYNNLDEYFKNDIFNMIIHKIENKENVFLNE